MVRGELMNFLAVFAVLWVLAFTGCASAPSAKNFEGRSFSVGQKAAATARAMVGKPYRFKGETPAGFDCSGLVKYSYRSAGLDLPHGTAPLRKVTTSVALRELREGYLVFFDQEGKKYSHVGIYAGDGRFVHAPSSGKTVRIDSLQDAYWKRHFVDARRYNSRKPASSKKSQVSNPE